MMRLSSWLLLTLIAANVSGDVPSGSERILLPILAPPVHGAFGSEFHTTLRISSKERGFSLYGLDVITCPLPETTVCWRLEAPIEFLPDEQLAGFNHVEMNGTPGRFVYVGSSESDAVAMNLRVHDVSRAALNFGTEIPVVRESEFVRGQIRLLGVPADSRFRYTLRVYGLNAPFVLVTIDGHPPVTLPLRPGATIYEPAYAQFSDFPAGAAGEMSVRIEPPTNADPIWAFVTVTNNSWNYSAGTAANATSRPTNESPARRSLSMLLIHFGSRFSSKLQNVNKKAPRSRG